MTNTRPDNQHAAEKARADSVPGTDTAREQELKQQEDQKKQEQKLRQSEQIDKGPSACNPQGRR